MPSRWGGLVCALLLAACQSEPLQPMKTVEHVDLARYMGNWYVIANIPPWIEKGAHNSLESYRLDPDGTVAIRFTYRKGSFEADTKKLESRGYVLDGTNALWGVKFWFWPVKADYRIVHVAPDYSQTVVARQKRDWVWIMARTPAIPDTDYAKLLELVAALGYDVKKVQKVPQKWN